MTPPAQPRAADDARSRILAAAIRLFAAKGVEGSSVREITTSAQVNLNAVNYYFGSKEALEEAVFAAVAAQVTEARRAALAQVLAQARQRGQAPAAADIVATFVHPYLDSGDHGTSSLLAKFVLKHRLQPTDMTRRLVQDHFDPLAREYIRALQQALPAVPEQEFVWRYMIMASAVVLMATDRAGVNRIRSISQGRVDAVDDSEMEAALTRFIVGGLAAPAPAHAPAVSAAKRRRR